MLSTAIMNHTQTQAGYTTLSKVNMHYNKFGQIEL